ncbi:MAG: nucleoside deaminase, partial [Stenotrophomonas maltophilia]|nr:nucleoside deaminase [Stenotrophomonas maltophilia]
IDRLLIGANSADVEELTPFDEGPLPADWVGELNKRGIEVVQGLNRDAARSVLRAYGESDGARY